MESVRYRFGKMKEKEGFEFWLNAIWAFGKVTRNFFQYQYLEWLRCLHWHFTQVFLLIGCQRVKVYRLNGDGKWDDQGTGHVSVDYLEVWTLIDYKRFHLWLTCMLHIWALPYIVCLTSTLYLIMCMVKGFCLRISVDYLEVWALFDKSFHLWLTCMLHIWALLYIVCLTSTLYLIMCMAKGFCLCILLR